MIKALKCIGAFFGSILVVLLFIGVLGRLGDNGYGNYIMAFLGVLVFGIVGLAGTVFAGCWDD